MSIDQAVKMKKSTWKREVKTKLKKKNTTKTERWLKRKDYSKNYTKGQMVNERKYKEW